MTLNIGGGFSLLRCASSRVWSFCCAMPPLRAPCPPANLTAPAIPSSSWLSYAMWGGGAMRWTAPSGADYVPFHGLACAQQLPARPLTTLVATRKRRAVFGVRLSVSPERGGGVKFQAWLGIMDFDDVARELKSTATGREHGNRHREGVQRREGLWFHYARRRQRGLVRAFLRH